MPEQLLVPPLETLAIWICGVSSQTCLVLAQGRCLGHCHVCVCLVLACPRVHPRSGLVHCCLYCLRKLSSLKKFHHQK